MKSTILFVVASFAIAGSLRGAGFTYVFDGEGEYADRHAREWSACWGETDLPAIWDLGSKAEGSLPDGTIWTIENRNIWYRTPDSSSWFQAGISFGGTTIDPLDCGPGGLSWTMRIDWKGNSAGRSYYLKPSWLSTPHDLNVEDPADAEDAAVLFRWWDTPVGDLNGDLTTDAADAGLLFADWSGDSAPSSVPEPSGISGLLPLLALGKSHPRRVCPA